MIEAVTAGNLAGLIEYLDELFQQGVGAVYIARAMSEELRQMLLGGQVNDWSSVLLRQLLEVPASQSPSISLEIALLEATQGNAQPGTPAPVAVAEVPVDDAPDEPISEPDEPPTPRNKASTFDEAAWTQITNEVKK